MYRVFFARFGTKTAADALIGDHGMLLFGRTFNSLLGAGLTAKTALNAFILINDGVLSLDRGRHAALRTFFYTYEAFTAFCIIDLRQIFFLIDRYRPERTVLLADAAGYAADLAVQLNSLALSSIAAGDMHMLIVQCDADDMARTYLHAGHAAGTFFRVNLRYAFFVNVYSTELTYLYAGTITEAAVGTRFGAAHHSGGFNAVLHAVIIIFMLTFFLTGMAAYKTDFFYIIPGFLPQNSGNLGRHGSSAYGTGVYR